MTRVFKMLAGVILMGCLPLSARAELTHVNVFESGVDGYQAYRIPAIETAADGSLLAFAEARKNNLGDPGMDENDIDLVFKRSTDQGLTWSPMRIIEDAGERWSAANPATVLDRDTGKIWLLYIRCKPGCSTESARPGTDDMQVLARFSDDHGASWSEPTDLTAQSRDMKDPVWRSSVIGPGGIIQDRKGRLVAPVWRSGYSGLFALFSEDHGKTWKSGQIVPGYEVGDENQIVELANGNLLMDYRQKYGSTRWFSESSDGGVSWTEPRKGIEVKPVCCAIERYTLQSAGDDRDRILWTGPKGPDRSNLAARISYDEGKTFPVERLIAGELAAYSDLTILKDKSVGVLWERGDYKHIAFTRLERSFLEP